MFCAHCGKEIPENSKFCCYCGQPAEPQPDVPVVESTTPQPDAAVTDSPTHPPVENQPPRSKKPLWIVMAVAAVACGALIFLATNAGSIQSAIATSSGSEYKNRMVELRPVIIMHSEAMVLKSLDDDMTNFEFKHDWDAFSNDGIFLTDCGTVTYNDSTAKKKTQDYAATMAINEQRDAYYLMLKLNGKILYDKTLALDNDGTIIMPGSRFDDRAYGEQIFDDPINPDKWAKNAADFHNAEEEITLAEFTALDLGIAYKEACAVIGSYGVETSRISVLGSETVIYTWEGIGTKDASATLTFVNDVLIAKEQTGLK